MTTKKKNKEMNALTSIDKKALKNIDQEIKEELADLRKEQVKEAMKSQLKEVVRLRRLLERAEQRYLDMKMGNINFDDDILFR